MSFVGSSKLFQPIKVGELTLAHRVVLAPLTRIRANKEHVHGSLAVEYYTQRSSFPGSLLISEGTFPAPQAGGLAHVPGITSDAQIAAWKKIVDAVHANGSFIYLQLWALGRAAELEDLTDSDPSFEVVGPSPIPLSGANIIPHELTIPEIKEFVEFYRKSAFDGVNKAGFDGVEIHMANGYLPDQFLQDVSNHRTDEYGGSVENRVRFPLEVVEAVVQAIGEEKTGVRISPWSPFQDMRMKDPKPTFAYLVTRIRDLYPKFAYLHAVEDRINGNVDQGSIGAAESNDFLREIWLPRPLISAGGFTAETAAEVSNRTGGLVAFGRLYIANPDLPLRLKLGLPLAKPDRSTFYVPESPKGYIDYPVANV
jgi:NADPH2 dehydrogenase